MSVLFAVLQLYIYAFYIYSRFHFVLVLGHAFLANEIDLFGGPLSISSFNRGRRFFVLILAL